jgi:hypothetical protein
MDAYPRSWIRWESYKLVERNENNRSQWEGRNTKGELRAQNQNQDIAIKTFGW